MKIKGKKVIFEYEMNPEHWWLLNEKGNPSIPDSGIWWLALKLDRSYKGKEPDIAVPDVQLTRDEADLLYKKFKLDKVWYNL